MSKEFVVATITANGTRWNVELSDRKGSETFVAKNGALSWLESAVASVKPVQALVYHPGGNGLSEAWFFENGTKRKLNVLTLAPERQER